MLQLEFGVHSIEHDQKMKQTEWNTVDRRIRDELAKAEGPLIAKATEALREEFRPRGWRRATIFLREWGLAGTAIMVPIALLAIAAGAIYVAVARVDKQARFETNTTNTLSAINEHLGRIDQSLTAVQLRQTISQPTDRSDAIEAKKVIVSARENSVKLPADLIEQVGQKFLNASVENPPAWDTTLAMADYRSYLNGPELSLEAFYPLDSIPSSNIAHTHYHIWTGVGGLMPKLTTSLKRVPIAQSAILEIIASPEKQEAEEGPEALLAVGGNIRLDGLHLRNVVLEGVTLNYGGAPLILENVIFINCKFVIENVGPGRALGSKLLEARNVTFRAPSA